MLRIKDIKEKPFIEITENPFTKIPVYRSELVVGDITIRFTKKFNWFNRLMLKFVFGLEVTNIC